MKCIISKYDCYILILLRENHRIDKNKSDSCYQGAYVLKKLSNEDMEYLQRCSQPKVERFHQNTGENGLQFMLELEPNEIAVIQIRSMLTHRQAL